jgi:hypothetical protein
MGPSETSPIAQFLTIEPDPKLDAPLRQAVERGVSEEAVKLFPPPYPSPRLTMRLYGVGKEVRLLRVNAAYDAGKSSGTLSVDFAIKNGVLTARKVVRSGKGECPESANEFYDNIFDFGADGSPQVIERFAFFDSSRNPPSCQQTTRVYQIGEDGLPAEPPMLQIDPPPPEDDEVDL